MYVHRVIYFRRYCPLVYFLDNIIFFFFSISNLTLSQRKRVLLPFKLLQHETKLQFRVVIKQSEEKLNRKIGTQTVEELDLRREREINF